MESIFSTSLKMMQKTFARWFDAPNFIWDVALCYGIGPDHAVGSAKIFFVTDDEAICNAAIMAGCNVSVMKFNDYIAGVL